MKVAGSFKTQVHNDTTTWCHNSVDQHQEYKWDFKNRYISRQVKVCHS
jgi:hypothetical protein